MTSGPSDKSRGVALVLAFLLGMFGGHRFYAGKPGTGILMALTLGGAGLWWLYDLILVASGGFRDGDGRLISRWEPDAMDPALDLPAELLAEVRTLHAEVAELTERVDFAERLLGAPREAAPVPRGGSRP